MNKEPKNTTTLLAKSYPYDSVVKDLSKWPIYLMYQDREQLIQQVTEHTIRTIILQKKGGTVSEKIAKVLYDERIRIIENPWKVDPPDEMDFWSDIRHKLVKGAYAKEEEDSNELDKELLERIVKRYVREITGNFRISTYKLARKVLPVLFSAILNTITLRRPNMAEKIQIVGAIEDMRSLLTKGTIVLVPTHFSNLDSILIGWAADRIGMAAFSYGAGLNLYNNNIMAYFFARLGAYTLDRRKKNSFYLEALKSFSQVTIEKGVHTLFFPGGTRSRSGQLESKVKLGLLGTVVDAQCALYERNENTKIFLVPVVLNYHVVLEAKSLIEQYLKHTGKELYLVEKDAFGGFSNLLKFFSQFVTATSEVVVNFGKPIDVMGNFVNAEGESLDQWGNPIQVQNYFVSGGGVKFDRQRNEEYTKRLADKLVERYHIENVVLSSHLVAFTAFRILQKKFKSLDIYALFRIPKEDRIISKELFYKNIETLRSHLIRLESEGRVKLSDVVRKSSVDELVKHGVQNVGAFHVKKPLRLEKKGDLETQDINLLYYYHNRMEGYKLDKLISV